MHSAQADVLAFHREVLGRPEQYRTVAVRRPTLRASLVQEEADELVAAIDAGDVLETLRESCDLLYVVYGTVVEMGADLEPFWREVHRSNMAKAGGPVREDGKRLRPPGWTPPNLAGVLAEVARGT